MTCFSGLARILTLAGGSSVLLSQASFAQYAPGTYPVPGLSTQMPTVAGYNTMPQAQQGWVESSSPYHLTAQQAEAGLADHIPQGHVHVPAPIQAHTPAPIAASPAPLYQPTPMAAPAPGAGCACAPGAVAPQPIYAQPVYAEQAFMTPASSAPLYGPAMGLGNRWSMGNRGASMYFGGANALILKQQDTRYVRLATDDFSANNPVLTTRNARLGTAGGVEFFVGRYFNCGRNALMGSYWGLFPGEQVYTVYPTAPDALRSDLRWTLLGPAGLPSSLHGLEMPGGRSVYSWFDDSDAQRIRRDNEIHNIEINFLSFALGGAAVAPGYGVAGGGLGRGGFGSGFGGGYAGGGGSCGAGSCGDGCGSGCAPSSCVSCMGGPGSSLIPASCGRLRFTGLAGVRWFRFQDEFEYASSDTDVVFTTTDDDFYYRSDATNDLVGFQLGSLATYCLSHRVNLYAGTKFGIYGNHMRYGTYAGTTNTAALIVSSDPAVNGRPFDYTASRTDVAFLGEGDAGLAARISKCWSANIGYRVIAASGVATSTGNIPYDFSRPGDILRINNSDSLILHGLVVGGTYNF